MIFTLVHKNYLSNAIFKVFFSAQNFCIDISLCIGIENWCCLGGHKFCGSAFYMIVVEFFILKKESKKIRKEEEEGFLQVVRTT